MWSTRRHISTIAKLDFKNENRSQLEKAAFLSLATGILHHGLSWVPYACGTTAHNKGKAGTSFSSAGGK
jgi:hypothetical protein